MSKKNNLRVKNMMYEQQISHLPNGMTADDVYDTAVRKLQPARCAMVVHNKDKADNGAQVDDHVHMMMTFTNARSINSVANQLGDKPQYIEKWDDRADNGFAYLVHRTPNAVGKFQYDVKSVRANFDYPALLRKMEKIAQKAKVSVRVTELLDAFKDGQISKLEVERQLSGTQYGQYQPQLERIHAQRLREMAREWRENAVDTGKTIKLIWIAGYAGTGKTSLAKEYAAKRDEPYYMSGSSRDLFQRYEGQHTIILDEFRPGLIGYSDFLRMTDPYAIQNEVMAPARYADKAIASDLYIVTSPYDPKEYYDYSRKRRYIHKTDSFEQLERRIAVAIMLTEDEICRLEWDEQNREYTKVKTSVVKNPYSHKSRPTCSVSADDVYLDIIDGQPGPIL